MCLKKKKNKSDVLTWYIKLDKTFIWLFLLMTLVYVLLVCFVLCLCGMILKFYIF